MVISTSTKAEIGENTFGSQLPFDAIDQPGTYVCNWSGHLVRVPGDPMTGQSMPVCIVGREPLFVTKISNEAFLPITEARTRAAECHLRVNF